MDRWTRFLARATLLHETRPDPLLGAQSSDPSFTRALAESLKLIGQEPVAEGRVVAVRVDDQVGQVRIVNVTPRDRVPQPLVVALGREIQDPARHRGGDAVLGQFADERVDHFGEWSLAKYAVARRSTSTSCSKTRLRRRSSRIFVASASLRPGRTPSSTSALLSHSLSVASEIPKSRAICARGASCFLATRTTSSRNSRGYLFDIAAILSQRNSLDVRCQPNVQQSRVLSTISTTISTSNQSAEQRYCHQEPPSSGSN